MPTTRSGAAEPANGHDQDTEIELKLQAPPDAMTKLQRSAIVRSRARGRAASHDLLNVYYDTSDRRLQRRGISLRVRRVGRRFVQTIKWQLPDGGPMARGEWECELPSIEPDLTAVDDPQLRARIGLILPGELERLFTSRIKRRTRVLYEPGDGPDEAGTMEMAIDTGRIDTAAGSEEVGEIELELLRGSSSSLYRVALEMSRMTPLRVGTLSKAARGYLLASGAAPGWNKAAPVRLVRDLSVDKALSRIFKGCVGQWLDNEAAAVDGTDPEGVHQMRVGLRRLRSGLSVFRRALPEDQCRWMQVEAKWLINALGPARDRDVFDTELLAPLRQARPEDASLEALHLVVEADRKEAYRTARRAIASQRYTTFLLRACQWIEDRGWRYDAPEEVRSWQERPVPELAAAVLDKRHRQVRKAGRGFADLSVEDRHRVRIALKKLRYTAEFFEALYPGKAVRRYRKAASALQDCLGHLNDVAVSESLLAETLARHAKDADQAALHRSAGEVIGWYARAVADIDGEAVASWRRFADCHRFWRG